MRELDRRQYDAQDQAFRQVHFLRFEIDRTKMVKDEESGELVPNRLLNVMKLTDIDCYLDSNRHARLHKE